MRKSESFSHHIYETFLSILSSIPVESEFFVINRESINDALIIVRLLFAKLNSRRKSCRCFNRSDTFQLIDISRARGGWDMRIEGNKRSSLFRALHIFLYDRSCVFCERIACAISTLRFEEGRGKSQIEYRSHNKIKTSSWLYLSLILKLF